MSIDADAQIGFGGVRVAPDWMDITAVAAATASTSNDIVSRAMSFT
jgi:hypothetical protein